MGRGGARRLTFAFPGCYGDVWRAVAHGEPNVDLRL